MKTNLLTILITKNKFDKKIDEKPVFETNVTDGQFDVYIIVSFILQLLDTLYKVDHVTPCI